MNGIIKLDNTWQNLNGADVTDINGQVEALVMLPDDEFYLQVRTDTYYGQGAAGIWFGAEPNENAVDAAEILPTNTQYHLVKGTDDIWVRALDGNVKIIIRKVQ